jgi:hypothetical protein
MEALRNRSVFASTDYGFELRVIANDNYFMGNRDVPDSKGGQLQLLVIVKDDDEPIGKMQVCYGKRFGKYKWINAPKITTPAGEEAEISIGVPYISNGWYFVKITQKDGDVIYSAPVWTAEE